MKRSVDSGGAGLLTLVGMAVATLMIAQHIAGKATRDALFLSYFDVRHLPKLMMASAALSVVAVVATSRMLSRFGPARLIPLLFIASGVLLAGQWVLAGIEPQYAAVVLYMHVAVINGIAISGFWSLINERFDPYAAKKIIPRLVAASTFGGLLGGVSASAVASFGDTRSILLMLSVLHVVCGFGVGWLARGHRAPPARTDEPPASLLDPLRRSQLIRRMALLALLVATTAAVLDYILKAEASASLASDQLIIFFSYFYTAVGFGTFLVQAAVGNKALKWFGLGGSMAAWPVAILLTGGGVLLVRSLVTVTLMRASANLLYNSFFRSGFELLYTPIAPADKRTGKILIDVGADRFGDMLGGLVVMGILLIPAMQGTVLLTAAMVLAALCLLLILVLHGGYVGQLADNLRIGQAQRSPFEPAAVSSARESLATGQTTIDRKELMEAIQVLRRERPDPSDTNPEALAPGQAGPDPIAESIGELRSRDARRIRKVLASRAMTPELLPHAIPLLADDRVLREASGAIRRVATSATGQLIDALLDPAQIPRVKRRLPLLLLRSDNPLAVHGLAAALDDHDWNVRFRCAEALERLRRRRPDLRADPAVLERRIEREARVLAEWGRGRAEGEALASRRAEIVFLLLGALHDPDNLDLCLLALRSADRVLRGTALEYLENLLSPELWSLLRPVVMHAPVAPPSQVADESLKEAAARLGSAAAGLRDGKNPETADRITDGG